jgi:hypothetical protein
VNHGQIFKQETANVVFARVFHMSHVQWPLQSVLSDDQVRIEARIQDFLVWILHWQDLLVRVLGYHAISIGHDPNK